MPLRVKVGTVLSCLILLTNYWGINQSLSAHPRPNLIVIMADDLGYEGLSCFGNPYFKTPALDRMAAEGMRLTDFHSSGTVCSPTRTGLLTGRYQQRADIEAVIHPYDDHPEHRKGLQLSETTFAEELKKAGYSTAIIGKWHQGYPEVSDDYHPQNHGFDQFVGYHSGNIDYISHVGDHNKHDWWQGRQETYTEGYSTHLINQHATRIIREFAQAENPFCVYVAHEAVHNPVQVPGDPVRRTEEGWDRWDWKNAPEQERLEKYRGMTLPMDDGVGSILDLIKELKIEQQTLVLFFSDNGPAREFPSGSPELRGQKGEVYEGGHKVPAIAWWPGKIEAGSESDQPLISLDVMPTLLSLAGSDIKELSLDGVDLSPILFDQGTVSDRPLYWASLSNNGLRAEALREGNWKLVVQHYRSAPGTFENPTLELYRLDQDPQEKTNLQKQHPKKAQAMYGQLQAWYAETQESKTPQEGGWLKK